MYLIRVVGTHSVKIKELGLTFYLKKEINESLHNKRTDFSLLRS